MRVGRKADESMVLGPRKWERDCSGGAFVGGAGWATGHGGEDLGFGDGQQFPRKNGSLMSSVFFPLPQKIKQTDTCKQPGNGKVPQPSWLLI